MSDVKPDPVEVALAEAGAFKGFHGLRGLANASGFWADRMYGTRLYYGPGGLDYLHRGVLKAAIKWIEDAAVRLQMLERSLADAVRERDEAKRRMEQGWITVCETPIGELARENDQLREYVVEHIRLLRAVRASMPFFHSHERLRDEIDAALAKVNGEPEAVQLNHREELPEPATPAVPFYGGLCFAGPDIVGQQVDGEWRWFRRTLDPHGFKEVIGWMPTTLERPPEPNEPHQV
jgi:hypothetical protein